MTLDTFFAKFDQFADAPNAVAKMRELMLQLAVQGCLGTQCPDDEPADALAVTISKERAEFLKERSLARQRILNPVDDDQCPFAPPSGWVWTRLGNLCRVQPGFAFESAAFVQSDSDVPLIRIRDIANDHTQVNYVGEYREEFLVNAGDYLVGMDGNFTVAKWRGPRALLNQRVSRLQWYSKRIEPSFFAIAAQYRLAELQDTKAYTTVDHLSSKQIEEAVVPLPPFAEQKRIMAKVEELMTLCDRLEAQQEEREARHALLARASLARFADASTPANLNFLFHESYTIPPADLRKSILTLAVQGKLVPQDPNDEPAEELFARIQAERAQQETKGKYKRVSPLPRIEEDDGPFKLPAEWKWARLRSLVFTLGDGLHGTPEYLDGTDCYFINGNNLVDGRIVIKPRTKTVSLAEAEKHRKPLTMNTVLVSINGTLGSVAFYNNENVILGKSACYFDLVSLVDKHFVRRVIESTYFINYASENATGTTIRNLGLKAMNHLPVPLPPLAEQCRIVAKVDQLMALVDQFETQLTESRTRAQSLMEAVVAELTQENPHR